MAPVAEVGEAEDTGLECHAVNGLAGALNDRHLRAGVRSVGPPSARWACRTYASRPVSLLAFRPESRFVALTPVNRPTDESPANQHDSNRLVARIAPGRSPVRVRLAPSEKSLQNAAIFGSETWWEARL